jgi:hypothetical protein
MKSYLLAFHILMLQELYHDLLEALVIYIYIWTKK